MADPNHIYVEDVVSTESQALNEDELAVDPLDRGVEPPERWAVADEYGISPNEERGGDTLDQRLPQDEPDILPDEQRPVPVADETDYPPEG